MHSKHSKHDKHKEEKHHESSGHHGHLPAALAGILPGHEKHNGKLKKEDGGKLKKEDVHELKLNQEDISEEERKHRKVVMGAYMTELVVGVVGAGAKLFC